MNKALITGAGGFVGQHLINHLYKNKISTIGLLHPDHPLQSLNKIKRKATFIKCDILKSKSLNNIFEKNKFDFVFHLAAFSSPPKSFDRPKETLENNIISELNLLETIKKNKSRAKILIIGSSDEYRNSKLRSKTINEKEPLKPDSPYAVSKVAQDFLGWQYYINYKLSIVRVRPFNHIGPGQSTDFVASAFASKIASLETKKGGVLRVGNLNSFRDFTDVRDIAEAYLLALEKGKLGEVYNIGSGKTYKIADLLKILLSMSKIKIKVERDNALYRDSDINKVACDYSKFKKRTGWIPKIPIDKTLFDTINYERNKLFQNAK